MSGAFEWFWHKKIPPPNGEGIRTGSRRSTSTPYLHYKRLFQNVKSKKTPHLGGVVYI
jgi:hypothetical protein